jgi:hypothetical protein
MPGKGKGSDNSQTATAVTKSDGCVINYVFKSKRKLNYIE